MSRLGQALLVVVVLAAGCAGFTADDPETPGPVSVPEVTIPTPEVAPGVTRERVVDPDTLLAAHVARLGNASYLFTYDRTVASRGESQRRVIEGRIEADPDSYRVSDLRVDGDERNRTTYRVTDGRLQRRTDPAGEWTAVNGSDDPYGTLASTRTGPGVPDPTFRERLATTLTDFELVRLDDIDNYSPSTTTYYYWANETTTRLSGEQVRNLTVLLKVEPGGIVMSYRISYERVATGERVTERLTYEAVWFGRED
jgi:hypothetical protein